MKETVDDTGNEKLVYPDHTFLIYESYGEAPDAGSFIGARAPRVSHACRLVARPHEYTVYASYIFFSFTTAIAIAESNNNVAAFIQPCSQT